MNSASASGMVVAGTKETKKEFATDTATCTACSGFTFNASKSSSIYKSSANVVPTSRKTRFFIKY